MYQSLQLTTTFNAQGITRLNVSARASLPPKAGLHTTYHLPTYDATLE